MFRPHQRVVHVVTGSVYRVVDVPPRLRLAATDEPAYSYTLAHGDPITLWAMPQAQFEGGQFVPERPVCG